MATITPTQIQAPRDLLTVNQWVMNIETSGLSGKKLHFSKVSGPSLEQGVVEHADGGTGLVYKFGDGKTNFGMVTLSRVRMGGRLTDNDDSLVHDTVRALLMDQARVNGTLIKKHHGSDIMKITFLEMQFTKITLPDFDVEGSDKYEEQYEAQVTYWEEEAIGTD